jgi:hypothetical protein
VIETSTNPVPSFTAEIARSYARCRAICLRLAPVAQRFLPHLSALSLVLVTALTFGCDTTHATLDFIAPSTATAGTPFTVTVTVLYRGKPDTVINSHIHFTSSDPAAVVPGDYYFTPADAGSHTWTNGFTLNTPGSQVISGDIFDATGINGSATIAVSP